MITLSKSLIVAISNKSE